jgi:hypothetical protein
MQAPASTAQPGVHALRCTGVCARPPQGTSHRGRAGRVTFFSWVFMNWMILLGKYTRCGPLRAADAAAFASLAALSAIGPTRAAPPPQPPATTCPVSYSRGPARTGCPRLPKLGPPPPAQPRPPAPPPCW